MVAKKDIDWGNLGFSYHVTDKRYVSMYQDGKWDDGALISDDKIVMSEDAGVLQYSQSVFEGLKAYETEDGHIVCFRPDLNAQRMYDSALRLEMPPFPVDRFVEAVKATVKANEAWVPPYGTGATLYIRPYMFGISPVIGVKPADDYMFRIFTTPVGPYFKGGAKPIVVRVSDFDRAAPRGTGHIKAGLNYAMSLHARRRTQGRICGEYLSGSRDKDQAGRDRRRQYSAGRPGQHTGHPRFRKYPSFHHTPLHPLCG